jgi:hypothetical protein
VVEDCNECITISAKYSPRMYAIKNEQYITILKPSNHFIAVGDYTKYTQWESKLILLKEWDLLKNISLVTVSTRELIYCLATGNKKISGLPKFRIIKAL